jgi:hypothetical protein
VRKFPLSVYFRTTRTNHTPAPPPELEPSEGWAECSSVRVTMGAIATPMTGVTTLYASGADRGGGFAAVATPDQVTVG